MGIDNNILIMRSAIHQKRSPGSEELVGKTKRILIDFKTTTQGISYEIQLYRVHVSTADS